MPRNLYPVLPTRTRSILAGETLLEEVFADARLHTAIEAWLAATPLLPAIPSRVDLRDVCERVVFHDLHLPAYSYLADWIEMIVLQSFLTGGQVVECDLVEPTRTLDPRPGEPLALTLRRTAQQRRPVGVRRPKVGDTSIVEGVRYWDRHDVAKTTSIHALARERDSRPDDETDRRTIRSASTARRRCSIRSVSATSSTTRSSCCCSGPGGHNGRLRPPGNITIGISPFCRPRWRCIVTASHDCTPLHPQTTNRNENHPARGRHRCPPTIRTPTSSGLITCRRRPGCRRRPAGGRRAGLFPAPIVLSKNAIGWRRRDIAAWLDSRQRQVDPLHPSPNRKTSQGLLEAKSNDV